jgi:LPXTG-motif cell wall-anchored protein
MHKLRVAAAATVIAVVAAFASMGQASAATTGVGTTETSTSLVDVALGSAGSLLHLRLVGDDAKATVDPGVGPTSAFSQLFALKATSSVISLLNFNTPLMESKAPGGVSPVTGPAINLASLVPTSVLSGLLPVAGALVSGSLIPVGLTSSITDGVAKSGLNLNLADLGLVGGLVSVHAVDSTLGAAASSATADGSRLINVDAVSVLNLGALLKGLGIDLKNLPIATVSGLLSNLSTTLTGLPAGSTLGAFVTTLNDTLTSLTAASGTFSVLPAPLQGTLTGLGLPVAVAGVIPDATAVNTLITQVTDTLSGILETAMNTLDGLDLLKLNGFKVGTVTKATNTVAGSKSEVIAQLGGVGIGNLPVLSGIDLTSTLAQVTDLVNTIQGTLDGVLSPLGLGGLISVKFFDKASTNGVSTSGGYVRSLAGITGLSLAITPPAGLAGIISGLVPASGIGQSITDNGGTIPVVSSLMSTLNGTAGLPSVGGVVSALAGGATFKVASVATGSNFAAPAATATPVSQLPRTGANTTVFLVIGMLMVGAVLLGRRYIPRRVHADS